MRGAIRIAIYLLVLAPVDGVGDAAAISRFMRPNQRELSTNATTTDLAGKGCRAVTNIYNTVPTETLRQLVPPKYTLLPSPVTKTPIVYLHSIICERFSVGPESGSPGGFALSAISIQPNDIVPTSPRNLYTIYTATNIAELQEAFRVGGIDSYATSDIKLAFPSATQTVLNVSGGTSPFTLTIDADRPTVPQPTSRNSFNFVGFNNGLQTVLHFEHIEFESRPGYRGTGTFIGKEGSLLHRLLAGPPTYTALSVPMDFKGSITRSGR
jgi:hypothetical protein